MPPDINDLLKRAEETAAVERAHRNDQYIPVVKTLVLEKNMTTNEVKDWFKKQGITLGAGWVAATRTKIIKDDDASQEAPAEAEESLQPVASPPVTPPIRTRTPPTA